MPICKSSVKAYNAGDDDWAWGEWWGEYRVAENASQGQHITSAEIKFNMQSDPFIGYTALGQNWDYKNNAGKPTRSIELNTTGSNISPLSHYDNQDGGSNLNKFADYNPVIRSDDFKDDLIVTWSNPASGDIPDTERIHVGLKQDVPDWFVRIAEINHPDGTSTFAPMMGIHVWGERVTSDTPAPESSSEGGVTQQVQTSNSASGFRIVAPNVTSIVSQLSFAIVTDLNLDLDDLTRETLEMLDAMGRLEHVTAFDPTQIDANGDFVVVLDGTQDDLPPELILQGNYLILNRPDLLSEEVFVYVQSDANQATIGNYALLNESPITAVPEPATMSLLALGGLVMLRRKPITTSTPRSSSS